MKKLIIGLLLIIVGLSACKTRRVEHENIYQLIERILPGKSSQFVLEDLKDMKGEIFELSGNNGKIVIKATNDMAFAKAFGSYLKKYCNTSVSWYLDDPVGVPDELPMVETPVIQECRFEKRFFLNYCTFGYTMLSWQWDDWERFIDWMALNGINMPLAITGQEAVWMEVWKDFGMTEEEIRAYFTGPAHLPWHRMGNLDGFLGPLPQSYIDHQFELQKKILERERSLGMTPVLPAFAGHVPKAINEKYPDAKITSLGSYGVGDQYQAYFLDPMDSLFVKIQQKFLTVQTKVFGTDHFYGADPFNEMDPPETTPEYLASVSKTIYDGMSSIDPDAKWVQMGWTFYYMKLWKEDPARLEAMIKAVPENKMIILDYFAEKEEVWRNTQAWNGAPFIWCYLGNFGGNTEMAAPIIKVAKRLSEAENDPDHGKFNGIGSTLEGFNVNRFIFEWLFDYAWDKNVTNLQEWIRQYTKSKTKNDDPVAYDAYKRMIELVYNDQVSDVGTGSLMQARPFLTGVKGYQRPNKYNYQELTEILGVMLSANKKSLQSIEYQKDLVVVTKQVLDNLIIPIRKKINEAYINNDSVELKKQIEIFAGILDDADRLLATQSEFLLGKWINDARSFGNDSVSKAYYEKNARVLITTWGNEGNGIIDYASRDLSGLISSYYKVRWQKFFDILQQSLKENKPLLMDSINKNMASFEWDWTNQRTKFTIKPQGNSLEIVKEIYAKYKPLYNLCNY
ncbi:alpha-N-acetylglucosaminidase [Labilibaculum euxinus]|uniref:Alpha-N-acetylglucosaminidase n=1 Tax=Labilibaculum euxinus TaxID=2686357 RepID=A0A7M4D4J8_9BACT|nr:alpha-N-acetylglucosaminidase [Labilibaculum euxinus]MUP37577.1 alpha-N-acetylglucosaminidase [Labilibaculum euxinus]MVB06782.1 alpha-N-acetylglucosaminidase [Labilibaculum euxinus]